MPRAHRELRIGLLALSALAGSGCPTSTGVDGGADAPSIDAPDTRDARADAGGADAALDASEARDVGEVDGSISDAADSSMDASGFDAPTGDATSGDAARVDAASGDAPSVDAPRFDVPSDAPITRMDDPPTHPAAPPIRPFSTCTVTTSTDTISVASHLPPCTAFAYPFLPPSAGPHYSIWANFGTYTAPVPWGFLVHAMEHGAVVLAYNCATPTDCDAVRTEFQAIIDARGVDPICRMELWPNRIIVVPDPTLPVPIAAVAWRHVYTATCLDPTSLRAFVDAHYDMATESFCVGGTDLSATGWCP